MSAGSTVLLQQDLKELKLPTFLREYDKMAALWAAEGVDHPYYLLRLAELELIDRHHRKVERRNRAARYPAVKSLSYLRLPRHSLAEQATGHAVGPLRVRATV